MRTMFNKMSPIILASFVLILTSCGNAVKFAGSARSKAVPKVESNLACETAPGTIKANESLTIKVSANEKYSGEIYQKVLKGEEVIADTKLVRGDNNLFVKEDTKDDTLAVSAVGEYKVELRETKDASPYSTCKFSVTAENVEPTDDDDDVTTCDNPIGGHIAFLIDNSNSNDGTDCPDSVLTGETIDGINLKECKSATNREKAVLSAFELLRKITESEKVVDKELAKSTLAIASFPIRANSSDLSKDSVSYKIETGWTESISGKKASIENALSFTRYPFGRTPYAAAMNAGQEIFKDLPDDEKSRLVVLVTDGEPTDQNPVNVASMADELRAKGVEVVTVFVNNGESRTERQAKHMQMLRDFDEKNRAHGKGNWWTTVTGVIESIDQYFNYLLGLSGEPSLVERVSANKVIEVSNSSALNETFKNIVKTRAIRCE